MKASLDWRDRWSALPFNEFDQKHLDENLGFWQHSAYKIISTFEKFDSAVMVAGTATGKTIMGFLTALAGEWRVLFIAPSRFLAGAQHPNLWERISGRTDNYAIYTGETTPVKRIWYKNLKILFSTPQTFMNDWTKQKISVLDFDLIIIDEFHHCDGGKTEASKIAYAAEEAGLKLLGLTASPGGSLEKIDFLMQACKIQAVLGAKKIDPPKRERLISCDLSEQLSWCERVLKELLLQSGKEISNDLEIAREMLKNIDPDAAKKIPRIDLAHLLRHNQLKEIHASILTWREFAPSIFFGAISDHAYYCKLYYSYRTILTESYASFIDYTKKLKVKAGEGNKAAKKLLANKNFQGVMQVAIDDQYSHPKARALWPCLQSAQKQKFRTLVFVRSVYFAQYLTKKLNASGIRVRAAYGQQKIFEQEKIIDELKRGELDCIISTSTLYEGANIQELDIVILFGLPVTEIQLLQASGRVGRMKSGTVIIIVLNHVLDRALYYGTKRAVAEMKSVMEDLALAYGNLDLVKEWRLQKLIDAIVKKRRDKKMRKHDARERNGQLTLNL